MLLRKPAVLLLSCSLLAPLGCRQRLTAGEQQGASLYQTNCSPCHEDTPEGLLKQPPRLNRLFQKETLPDGVPTSDQAVHDVIVEGLRTMPAFNGRLSEDQVQLIIHYLHIRN